MVAIRERRLNAARPARSEDPLVCVIATAAMAFESGERANGCCIASTQYELDRREVHFTRVDQICTTSSSSAVILARRGCRAAIVCGPQPGADLLLPAAERRSSPAPAGSGNAASRNKRRACSIRHPARWRHSSASAVLPNRWMARRRQSAGRYVRRDVSATHDHHNADAAARPATVLSAGWRAVRPPAVIIFGRSGARRRSSRH